MLSTGQIGLLACRCILRTINDRDQLAKLIILAIHMRPGPPPNESHTLNQSPTPSTSPSTTSLLDRSMKLLCSPRWMFVVGRGRLAARDGETTISLPMMPTSAGQCELTHHLPTDKENRLDLIRHAEEVAHGDRRSGSMTGTELKGKPGRALFDVEGAS